MYRYIAFSWNAKDPAKTATVRRLSRLLLSSAAYWQGVLDVPGLRVFHATQPGGACRAYILKRDAGVVLGKLFASDFEEDSIFSDPTFDDKESELLIESQGRHLVERYWGHYVALLRASDGQVRYVLRDPTGGLQCYLTNTAGIDVILSDVEDCVRLNMTPFSVDWNHVAAFFLHTRLITRTTGFREITQLYAGECAAIKDNAVTSRITRSFYWDPVTVYEADMIEDPDEARVVLRGAVKLCINAWASSYGSIVHELSGGLDSSIVTTCLANVSTHPDVLCFHYFTEMSDGDERQYARAVARSSGCELIESEVRVSERTLDNLLSPSRFASPAMVGLIPESELLKQRFVAERCAGAVFSGHGGDQLFHEARTKLIAAEYAYRHGVRPQLFRVTSDISRLTGQSIWSVLGAVVRHGLLGRRVDPYSLYFSTPSVLSENTRASLNPQAYTHPWVESAARLPASKIEHIFNVVDCQPFYRMACPYAEQVHPLISQPIIERCLQIPTYVLAHRGTSRGLVREAFDTDVPPKIIRRRSKGDTTSYFSRILVENTTFLREYLLNGVLVNEGILDRCELEKLLSERELILGNEQRSIMCSIAAEAWLSNWGDLRQRTAA